MEILQQFDNSIIIFIREYLNFGILDYTMKLISSLGNVGKIWIMIGILMLINKKYRYLGLLLLISLAITTLIGNYMIKPLVGRIRPFEQLGLDIIINKPHDSSFPSGHTAAAFAAAGVFRFTNQKYAIAMMIFAVLMAFSRMYLALHYPTDIIAGAVLGLTVSYLTVKTTYRISVNKYDP